MSNSSQVDEKSGVVYMALNGYGVTVYDLLVNAITILLGFVIIGLNALVFDTLVRVKRQRGGVQEPADWLVSSLTMSDLVTGLFLIYNSVYNITNFQIRTECLIRNALLHMASYASVFHLSLLTMDRYFKIILPYRYATLCNNRTVAISTAASWTAALVISLLPTFGWSNPGGGVGRDGEEMPLCSYFGLLHEDYLRLSISIYYIPLVVMAVMYSHIFKVAHRHARVIAVQEGDRPAQGQSWKYTKTVLLVMGLYYVCWLPASVVSIMVIEGDFDAYTVIEKGVLLMYAVTPAFANSATNPIIYSVKIPAVRARFRAVFLRKEYQVHPENSVTQVTTVRTVDRHNNGDTKKDMWLYLPFNNYGHVELYLPEGHGCGYIQESANVKVDSGENTLPEKGERAVCPIGLAPIFLSSDDCISTEHLS